MSHVVNDENIKMLARNIEFKTIVGVYSIIIKFPKNNKRYEKVTIYNNCLAGGPISYANVALCQKSDSTLLFGVVTNHDGCFEIKVEDAENSFLRVSCVGFQVQNVEIKKFP